MAPPRSFHLFLLLVIAVAGGCRTCGGGSGVTVAPRPSRAALGEATGRLARRIACRDLTLRDRRLPLLTGAWQILGATDDEISAIQIGTRTLKDAACSKVPPSGVTTGAPRLIEIENAIAARLGATLKVSQRQATGLLRTIVAETLEEARQHCEIPRTLMLTGTDAQFDAAVARLALGKCTGVSGGSSGGGGKAAGPGAAVGSCLQKMKDAMHPADECTGNPRANGGGDLGSCAGNTCFESTKDAKGNERIYASSKASTGEDLNSDGIPDTETLQVVMECQGACSVSIDEEGDLVIEGGEGFYLLTLDMNDDGTADEIESSGDYPPNGGGTGGSEEMCATFRVNARVAFGYRLSGGDGGSKIQDGPIDLASSFGTCVCQAGLASMPGSAVAGSLVDTGALVRSSMCPNEEDRTRHSCAVNPYGPNDTPRKECLDLAKQDAAATLAERKKALQCLSVQCNPVDQIAVFGTGEASSACGCLGVDAAERSMSGACMSMNCGDGQLCGRAGSGPKKCAAAGPALQINLPVRSLH